MFVEQNGKVVGFILALTLETAAFSSQGVFLIGGVL